MKLCKDCEHYIASKDILVVERGEGKTLVLDNDGKLHHLCGATGEIDPVGGGNAHLEARFCRSQILFCGPEARWFRQRTAEPETRKKKAK